MSGSSSSNIKWGGLAATLLIGAGLMLVGLKIAGQKFDIGPLAPADTPTPVATRATRRSALTPMAAALPLPAGAELRMAQAFETLRNHPDMTLGKVLFLGKCPENNLVENSQGQPCISMLLPALDATPSQAEAAVFFGEIADMIQDLNRQGWYGRTWVFILIHGRMGPEIGAVVAVYFKPGNPQMFYTEMRVEAGLQAPSWLLGE